MSNKILILGKDGQVGSALATLLGNHALAAGRKDIDLLESNVIRMLERFVKNQSLSVIINTAAYTNVDKAEVEGRKAAFRVNATAVGELATWCLQQGVKLVHYSTDYVFNGSGNKPWREDDTPAPINIYGQSKLAGEQAIQQSGAEHLIIRTSWVYDAHGKNFFTTILRLLHEKEMLNVVADQTGAPTYAPHLARATISALPQKGVLNLCASGQTSWHGFAQGIFALATSHDSSIRCRQINPIPSEEYPLPARRPLNSRLDGSRARNAGIALPSWETGLKECVEEKYAGSGLHHSGLKNHPA